MYKLTIRDIFTHTPPREQFCSASRGYAIHFVRIHLVGDLAKNHLNGILDIDKSLFTNVRLS